MAHPDASPSDEEANSPSNANRRDFLTGKALADAAQRLVDERLITGGDPGSRRGPPAPCLVEVSRCAMACEFQVLLRSSGEEVDWALEALDEVERIERQLSLFRADSQIAAINREAATRPVPIDTELYTLLEECLKIHRETAGCFDISASPLWRLWGFHRGTGTFPTVDAIAAALQRVGSAKVQLDAATQSVRFAVPGMEINLGAIGKGYALDRCATVLDERGIANYLIHGGQSSVLCRGERVPGASERGANEGWRVAILHPLRPGQRLGEVVLQNRALATSGSANQFFYRDGRRFSHVLDPRTGWPAEGLLGVTVLGPSAAETDALSTAFFVLGVERTLEFCANRPDLGAILVAAGTRSGELEIITAGLDDRTWLPG